MAAGTRHPAPALFWPQQPLPARARLGSAGSAVTLSRSRSHPGRGRGSRGAAGAGLCHRRQPGHEVLTGQTPEQGSGHPPPGPRRPAGEGWPLVRQLQEPRVSPRGSQRSGPRSPPGSVAERPRFPPKCQPLPTNHGLAQPNPGHGAPGRTRRNTSPPSAGRGRSWGQRWGLQPLPADPAAALIFGCFC